jgi:hypothetical protein
MWRDGGVHGMFKGNLATIMKVAPQTAVQFAVYDTITEYMLASMARVEAASGIPQTQQLTKWQHLLAGASKHASPQNPYVHQCFPIPGLGDVYLFMCVWT